MRVGSQDSQDSETAKLKAPEILIFFRMPKTGGHTMDAPLVHCFPGPQHFSAEVGFTGSALLTRSREKIVAKYEGLSLDARRAIRCVLGAHIPMGLHTMFDRPAKYLTIVRHPVDRVISSFYFTLLVATHVPSSRYIQGMTLEQYLDSGIGLDPFDQQVRMLSGCPDLDVPLDPDGQPISAPPVERRHLEMAKRNIEDHFVAASPLEEITGMLLFLRRLYGWNLRDILYQIRNVTPGRPSLNAVPIATRRRLEDYNRFDIELYDWVKARFAKQIRDLEPGFSRDRRRFEVMNSAAQAVSRIVPGPVRGVARRMLSSKSSK